MTKLLFFTVVIAMAAMPAFTTCNATAPSPADPAKVICFFANWAQYRRGLGRFHPGDIEPSLCTHITYAHLMVDLETHRLVQRQGNDHILLAGINALKRTNPALKVIISVGKY